MKNVWQCKIYGRIFDSRYFRDPIRFDQLLIGRLGMGEYLNYNTIPIEYLPIECQKLYSIVSGPDFRLNSTDFPDFSTAIENSLINGLCNALIKRKLLMILRLLFFV